MQSESKIMSKRGQYDVYVVFEDESGDASESNSLFVRSVEFILED
jgi:hypothetical protein